MRSGRPPRPPAAIATCESPAPPLRCSFWKQTVGMFERIVADVTAAASASFTPKCIAAIVQCIGAVYHKLRDRYSAADCRQMLALVGRVMRSALSAPPRLNETSLPSQMHQSALEHLASVTPFACNVRAERLRLCRR